MTEVQLSRAIRVGEEIGQLQKAIRALKKGEDVFINTEHISIQTHDCRLAYNFQELGQQIRKMVQRKLESRLRHAQREFKKI